MANAPKMKRVGYWSWKRGKEQFNQGEFSEIDITAGDRKAGYVSQPVYIDENEKPD